MILNLTVLEIYSSEAIGFGIFDRVFNFDNCQTEVVSDVISGMVVDPTGVKARVKFDDSRSNRSRDIRLPYFVRTTTPAYAGRHIRAKRRKAFCLKIDVLFLYIIIIISSHP